MEIIYNVATIKDIQILIDSRVEFLSEYWGQQDLIVENNLKKELHHFFTKALSDHSYISCIAWKNKKLIAIGGMKIINKPGSFRIPDGRCGYIMNMYTRPEFRKQGIASAILEKLMDAGKNMGIRFFELHSTIEGESVYQKSGFQLHDEPTYRKIVQ